jgi:hypothetical protein
MKKRRFLNDLDESPIYIFQIGLIRAHVEKLRVGREADTVSADSRMALSWRALFLSVQDWRGDIPYAELGIMVIFTPSRMSVKLSVKAVKS